jgi:hypothetical protein
MGSALFFGRQVVLDVLEIQGATGNGGNRWNVGGYT